ncbi:hypothetical protein F5Y18DRAFT_12824 [Xylariaceae sp. FL1019]|nr:hypothetical protein F5Y18DRAFT_12824 [Xylariaceae sp. FL1019]
MEDVTDGAKVFTKFASLPPELRIEIWRLCLPRRVIQLHDIQYLLPPTMTCRPPKAMPNPPLISRVCRESRAIALQNGSVQPTMGAGASVWYDQSTDVIQIGRVFTLASNKESAEKVDSLRSGLKAFVCRPATRISVAGVLIFLDDAHARWVVRRMVERLVCSIVVEDISICLPREEAVSSGLFGLFAESTTIHVDMKDSKSFAALFALYNRYRERQPTGRGTPYSINGVIEGRAHQLLESRNGIPRFIEAVKLIWLRENGALSDGLDSSELTLALENDGRYQQLLAQLPQFTFVMAIHLCTNPHHRSIEIEPLR